MKISQNTYEFQPVTVVLDNMREVLMLEEMARIHANSHARGPVEIQFAKELSRWLREEVKG